ncbi:hypothetical protein NCAS_0G03310 [Naumovozyma castellii]|uniref:SAP domain-containing protein n=1 Tax=Naumovozyma castellii TaxID=27288 RepID=G0VII3_NAUCA|nr:hypothetical protein NCAS_0G03310 [Naumovozyma castellii CBS 4309]CCC71218.1 hypothetical protein NCAS_0G03310 [Naumovozyma castellii CBS 4309]
MSSSFTSFTSSSPVKRTPSSSVFSRWKKWELHDLAEKLKIDDLPQASKKQVLVDAVLDYLVNLGKPLDYEHEFPELRTFYESSFWSSVKNESASSQEVSASDEQPSGSEDEKLPDEPKTESSTNFNTLNFKEIDEEEAKLGKNFMNKCHQFKFNFQEYVSDVINGTKRFNENVQDFLSTLATVDAMFYSVELFFLIKQLIAQDDGCGILINYLTPISIWVLVNILLPVFVSYYINFIRYDYAIEVDPMIFHLTKGLIALTVLNYFGQEDGVGRSTYKSIKAALTDDDDDEDDEGSVLKHIIGNISHNNCDILASNLVVINKSLGQLPLIFAVVGSFLTLYVVM